MDEPSSGWLASNSVRFAPRLCGDRVGESADELQIALSNNPNEIVVLSTESDILVVVVVCINSAIQHGACRLCEANGKLAAGDVDGYDAH